MKKEVEIYRKRSRQGGLFISFLLLLLFYPSHAITWEERGGEAIHLGAVTSTTSTPSGTYYTVTSNGVIAESRDGGVTWAPQIIGVTIQKMLNMLKMEFVMGKLDGVAVLVQDFK